MRYIYKDYFDKIFLMEIYSTLYMMLFCNLKSIE